MELLNIIYIISALAVAVTLICCWLDNEGGDDDNYPPTGGAPL